MAHAVPVVRRKQHLRAKYYEWLLLNQMYALFVSVEGIPGKENEFEVFVGGPRMLGVEAIFYASYGVLHGATKKYPKFEDHKFRITVRTGVSSGRLDLPGPNRDRDGGLSVVPEPEDSEVQGVGGGG